MKPFETVMKVLTVLAAVAGVVVILAAYGDKIVEWAKKMMEKIPCHSCDIIEFTPAEDFDEEAEAPAEDEPVAEDTDFEV